MRSSRQAPWPDFPRADSRLSQFDPKQTSHSERRGQNKMGVASPAKTCKRVMARVSRQGILTAQRSGSPNRDGDLKCS